MPRPPAFLPKEKARASQPTIDEPAIRRAFFICATAENCDEKVTIRAFEERNPAAQSPGCLNYETTSIVTPGGAESSPSP